MAEVIVPGFGPRVDGFAVGHKVIGFTKNTIQPCRPRPARSLDLVRRPANVPVEGRSTLYVAGTTAYATLRQISVGPASVVVVSVQQEVFSRSRSNWPHPGRQSSSAWPVRPITAARRARGDFHGVRQHRRERHPAQRQDSCVHRRLRRQLYVRLALDLSVAPRPDRHDHQLRRSRPYRVETEGDSATADASRPRRTCRRPDLPSDLRRADRQRLPLEQVREAYRRLEQRDPRLARHSPPMSSPWAAANANPCSMSTFAPRAAVVQNVGSTRAPRRSAPLETGVLRSHTGQVGPRNTASRGRAHQARLPQPAVGQIHLAQIGPTEHGQREIHLDQRHGRRRHSVNVDPRKLQCRNVLCHNDVRRKCSYGTPTRRARTRTCRRRRNRIR